MMRLNYSPNVWGAVYNFYESMNRLGKQRKKILLTL
jgi:hypothetical protein